MEWLAAAEGQTVGLDTAPLIYFIEEHPLYLPTVAPFFDALAQGRLRAVTSVVTLLEVLVHPLRYGREELAQQYRDILYNAEGLTVFPLTDTIAEEAAVLRAAHNLRTPDAIQLATAKHMGASLFLTNDRGLPLLPHVVTLVLDDLKAGA